MPANTEQWHAEIGSFNGCSQHLIVKLHLNLLNLLFSMFVVSFCIIAITVCYITKFQIILYLTTLFLCDFLAFLSTSILYSNFSHFSKFIFIKRSFTNFLYITSFIDVAYSTYVLQILLLQHGDRETNHGPEKEKTKNLSCCHWKLIALSHITYLNCLNLKHITQFINMTLSVYLTRSLTLQSKKGTNTSSLMSTICLGQIIQVIQNEVVFLSFTKKLRIVKSLSFNECTICKVSIQNSKGYVGVVYRSPSQNIFEFEFFLSKFEKVLSDTTLCNSLFTIILGDFHVKSSVWWTRDKTTIEGTQLESLTSVHGFHQLISQPTHLLPQTSSCIDLIFTDQPNLIVDSGVRPSLHSNCHHQITYCKINLILNIHLHMSVWFGTTIEQMLKVLKNPLSLLIGK